jgi:hypothetical protein
MRGDDGIINRQIDSPLQTDDLSSYTKYIYGNARANAATEPAKQIFGSLQSKG